MNSKKTKVLVISRNQNVQVNKTLKTKTPEQVNAFKYLGTAKTEDGRSQREILTEPVKLKKPSRKRSFFSI